MDESNPAAEQQNGCRG